MSGNFDFTFISFGAGVQSTALLVCSALGLHGVPHADAAVFADTGDEPAYVYQHLERMTAWAAERGIRVDRVSKGVLSEWVVNRRRQGRFVTVPLHTNNGDGSDGMLRRQCTVEFKVQPIIKHVRQLIGVKPRHKVRIRVRGLIGISADEIYRMKPSRERWITHEWPLVDAGLTREACKRIVREQGLPEPQRSACGYCPYHSDAEFLRLQREHPADFAKAVAFDRLVRDMTWRGIRGPAFVHRSLKPLEEVDFDPMRDQGDLFAADCEGMCGI